MINNDIQININSKYTNNELNRVIKKIAHACKIDKTISFHVSRHTFATCYLRKESGGTVHDLQKLLKHKKIRFEICSN